MTVLNLQVLANLDDAYEMESSGNMFPVAVWLPIQSNTSAASRIWGGIRWPYANLAKGDLINSCTLQLFVLAGDANFDIYFQKVAIPAEFSSDNGDITDRTRTWTSVAWVEDSLSGWSTSPELKDILQEVLNDFKPGALVLICKPRSDVSKTLTTRPYDGDAALGAKLDLDYTSLAIPYQTAGVSAKLSDPEIGAVASSADRITEARAVGPTSPIPAPARESVPIPPAHVRRQQEL